MSIRFAPGALAHAENRRRFVGPFGYGAVIVKRDRTFIDDDDQRDLEGSAIEANRFSTSTCSNFFEARRRAANSVEGGGVDGDPDLDTREPENVVVGRQRIAVDLDVDEMLGRLGTGQQPRDRKDEERKHVSACPEYRPST